MSRIVISEGVLVETTSVSTRVSLSPDTFLQPDVEPLSPQDLIDAIGEALDASDQPDFVVVADEPPPLGRSWLYDFNFQRRFRVAGGKGPVKTHGLSTLMNWVEKVLHSDRGASPIWPDGYGMEDPFDIVSSSVLSVPHASVEERVRDALIFHPRISDIQDFEIAEPDETTEEADISFTIVLDDDRLIPYPSLTLPEAA